MTCPTHTLLPVAPHALRLDTRRTTICGPSRGFLLATVHAGYEVLVSTILSSALGIPAVITPTSWGGRRRGGWGIAWLARSCHVQPQEWPSPPSATVTTVTTLTTCTSIPTATTLTRTMSRRPATSSNAKQRYPRPSRGARWHMRRSDRFLICSSAARSRTARLGLSLAHTALPPSGAFSRPARGRQTRWLVRRGRVDGGGEQATRWVVATADVVLEKADAHVVRPKRSLDSF